MAGWLIRLSGDCFWQFECLLYNLGLGKSERLGGGEGVVGTLPAQSLPFSKRNRTEGFTRCLEAPHLHHPKAPALAYWVKVEMDVARPRGCPEMLGTSVQSVWAHQEPVRRGELGLAWT